MPYITDNWNIVPVTSQKLRFMALEDTLRLGNNLEILIKFENTEFPVYNLKNLAREMVLILSHK